MPLLNPKSDNLIQMLSKTNKKDPRYPKSFRRVIPNYSSHVVQGPEADLTLRFSGALVGPSRGSRHMTSVLSFHM